MKIEDFNYILPEEQIAQEPLKQRDNSRMLVLYKDTGKIIHSQFKELPNFLKENDLLILNNTKVIKARIFLKKETGAKIEILLTKKIKKNIWETLIKPSKRVKEGTILTNKNYKVKILKKIENKWLVELQNEKIIDELGIMPLPPYIKKKIKNSADYQTAFAKKEGAVASPTAGRHFTERIFKKLKEKEIDYTFITLHTGIGTFLPIRTKEVEKHKMEEEYFEISKESAEKINNRKGKLIAIGTTVVRTLETIAKNGKVRESSGYTSLYIYPGYKFKIIEGLLTNFHLPKSTLLLLVSTFAGRDLIMKAYKEAIKEKYRFYSFGDCMLIL